MDIVIYAFIGLYALLTGVAGLQQWKEKGFHIRTFLFVVISTSILVTLFLPDKDLMFVLLVTELVLLHIVAIFEGALTNGKINYSHHIIRLFFHCILLVLVYKFLR